MIILMVNPKPGNRMAGTIMLPPSKKCALSQAGQKDTEDVLAISVPAEWLIAADAAQFSMSYGYTDSPKRSDRSFTAKFAVSK